MKQILIVVSWASLIGLCAERAWHGASLIWLLLFWVLLSAAVGATLNALCKDESKFAERTAELTVGALQPPSGARVANPVRQFKKKPTTSLRAVSASGRFPLGDLPRKTSSGDR